MRCARIKIAPIRVFSTANTWPGSRPNCPIGSDKQMDTENSRNPDVPIADEAPASGLIDSLEDLSGLKVTDEFLVEHATALIESGLVKRN